MVLLFAAAGLRAEPPQSTLEVLRELESKRVRIRHQMTQLPQVVETQTEQVMARLDAFWASEALALEVEAFLEAVETTMSGVGIPDRHSNMDVVGALYGSMRSSEAIDRIIVDYTTALNEAVQDQKQQFTQTLGRKMAAELQTAFDGAEKELAAHFDQILAGEFAHWPDVFQTVHLDELAVGLPDVETGPHPLQVATVVATIVATLAAAISKKISAKVGAKVAGKVAGKVLLAKIPLLGWIVIGAWVASDLQNARANLENDIRSEVIAAYREEVVPRKLWRESVEGVTASSRALTEKRVREQLERWTGEFRSLLDTFMDTALLLENPAFAAFIEERIESGMSVREVADLSRQIHVCFGPLVHRAPSVEVMLDMMVLAPSREDLTRLRIALGPVIFEVYAEHGRELLHALSSLGPQRLADMIRQDQDWRTFHRLSERYLPANASEQARNGFRLCIEQNIPLEGIASPDFFEAVAAHRELFLFLAERKTPPARMSALLQRRSVPDFLTQVLHRDPVLASALVIELDPAALARLAAANRLSPLLQTHQVSQTLSPRFPTGALVRKIADDSALLNIAEEFGINGLKIFFAYVGPDSGTAHTRRALEALALYRQGAPLEICMDTERLATTQRYYSIPMIGPALYAFMYPVHRALPVLAYLLILSVLLIPLVFIFRLLRPRTKRNRRQKKPVYRPVEAGRLTEHALETVPEIESSDDENEKEPYERKRLPKP